MMEQSAAPRDRLALFLGIACALLAVLTLLLARQNRSLKAELAAAANAPPPGGLKAGDTIAPFEVVDAAGNKTQLTFDGSANTLLLVFSATCGACQQTIPVWNRLLAERGPGTVHVVGIETDFEQSDSSNANLAIPDLRFPVFGAANPGGEPMTKFPAIPAAALVDGKGAVQSVWFGAPTDDQVAELRHALGPS